MELLILIWLFCPIICAVVAITKHRTGFGWFILGLFLGIFAFLIILILPDALPKPQTVIVQNQPAPDPPKRGRTKICPDCAEEILADAKVCKHCGYRFDGAPRQSPVLQIEAKPVAGSWPGKTPAATPTESREELPPQLAADRGWFIEVVGESNYQGELAWALGNSRKIQGHDLVIVRLEPEANNPHDPLAVRVTYARSTVGYLPRAAAKQYRAALGDRPASCTGAIVGGGEDDEGVTLMLGMYLNALWPPRFKT